MIGAIRTSHPGPGKGLKVLFAAVLGSYVVAFGIGLANAHFGWWGEERLERELREQAERWLASAAADPTCLPQTTRLQTTFGTISRVSFMKDLDRPLPAVVAQQRVVCAAGQHVTERWVLLGRPESDDAPVCLVIGRKEQVDSAIRRCGFVSRRFS
jgi:hypothetical protein